MSIYKGETQICGQENVLIDTTTSTTSSNAIANKTATAELNKKMNVQNPKGTGTLSMNRGTDEGYSDGACSTTLGYHCTARGDYSIATGISSKAFDKYSLAGGNNSITYTRDSIAYGNQCIAGDENDSEKYCAVAMGNACVASGQHAISMGKLNNATGSASISVGVQNNSTGAHSTAIGFDNNVTADGAIAIGDHNTASHALSVVLGSNNSSGSNYQFVAGKNCESYAGAFVLGGGSDETNKANIATIDWSGNAWYNGNITSVVSYVTGAFANKLATDNSGSSYTALKYVKNKSNNSEMIQYYRNDATNNIADYKIRLYNPADRTKYVDFDFNNTGGTPRFYIGGNQVPIIKSVTMTQTTGTTGSFLIFGSGTTYNNKKIVSIDLTSTNTRGFQVNYGKNSSGQWYGFLHSIENTTISLCGSSISYTVYYMD